MLLPDETISAHLACKLAPAALPLSSLGHVSQLWPCLCRRHLPPVSVLKPWLPWYLAHFCMHMDSCSHMVNLVLTHVCQCSLTGCGMLCSCMGRHMAMHTVFMFQRPRQTYRQPISQSKSMHIIHCTGTAAKQVKQVHEYLAG